MSKSKRIRIVHIISSLEVGGAQTILFDQIIRLPEFDHVVIYFRHGPLYARFIAYGITVCHMQGLLSIYDPVFFIRLYGLVRQLNPAFIHCVLWAASMTGSIIARLLSKPYIISLHNHLSLNGKVRHMIDYVLRSGTSGSFIAVSDQVAHSATGYYSFLPSRKIQVIENGIDVAWIKNHNKKKKLTRENLGFEKNHFIIGSVGRFDKVKNYSLLIESFALLHQQFPHARLIIVGGGPDEMILRAHIKKLGLDSVAHLVIDAHAIEWYHLFNIFVQTSKTEGISLALLEAMTFGLPCLVTGQTHSIIIHGYNGLLISDVRPISLSAAYAYLLNNNHVMQKLGTHAEKTVYERFQIESMICKYKNVFEHISNN